MAARLSIIRQIMDVATHPNVGVCWNSNDEDLRKPGLEYNFNLVKNRLVPPRTSDNWTSSTRSGI